MSLSKWLACALAALLPVAVAPATAAAGIKAYMDREFAGNAGVTVTGIRIGPQKV